MEPSVSLCANIPLNDAFLDCNLYVRSRASEVLSHRIFMVDLGWPYRDFPGHAGLRITDGHRSESRHEKGAGECRQLQVLPMQRACTFQM